MLSLTSQILFAKIHNNLLVNIKLKFLLISAPTPKQHILAWRFNHFAIHRKKNPNQTDKKQQTSNKKPNQKTHKQTNKQNPNNNKSKSSSRSSSTKIFLAAAP